MSSLSDMRHTKCPHCEQQMSRFPALSRRDNKTLICSDCGRREALEDIYNYCKWQEEDKDEN